MVCFKSNASDDILSIASRSSRSVIDFDGRNTPPSLRHADAAFCMTTVRRSRQLIKLDHRPWVTQFHWIATSDAMSYHVSDDGEEDDGESIQ